VEKHILDIIVIENKKKGWRKEVIGNYSQLWRGLDTDARAQ
jgi:hypothetical protein